MTHPLKKIKMFTIIFKIYVIMRTYRGYQSHFELRIAKMSKLFASILLLVFVVSCTTGDRFCGQCNEMLLSAEDGLEIEYSRYMGVWSVIEGEFEGRPKYMCIYDCQHLRDEMV